jgi:hypothetical protein
LVQTDAFRPFDHAGGGADGDDRTQFGCGPVGRVSAAARGR